MTPRSLRLSLLSAAVALAACGGKESAPTTPAAPIQADAGAFERDVKPFLAAHCVACHGATKRSDNLALDASGGWGDEASARAKARTLRKVRRQLQSGAMPPKGKPRPPTEAQAAVLAWIDGVLAPPPSSTGGAGGAGAAGAAQASAAAVVPGDPGRVTLRRLNRAEYRNTIRDLLAIDYRPADEFPADDVGYGFDDIGDVLSMPPILLEKYVKAAEKISQMAVVVDDPSHPATHKYAAKTLPATAPGGARKEMRALVSNGEVFTNLRLPRDGEYVLKSRAFGQQAGPDPARMAFQIDGKPVAVVDVLATEEAPETYEVRVRASAGLRRIGVAFVNDFYDPKSLDPKNRDRNLIVDTLEIAGPVDALAETLESHKRIMSADPGGKEPILRASAIFRALASKAWRRPATDSEVARLVTMAYAEAGEGDPFERGIRLGLQAILVSPHFLFHVEVHPTPDDPKAVRTLDDYELASRLSYFLWSSMPDAALFADAAGGALKKNLRVQVARMLKDPKSGALVDGFADQWLELRRLKTVAPDPQQFPRFDERLREDMLRETEMFFEAVVWEDRSVLDFLDAPFSFLNERLAKHYGIAGVEGDRFRRVALPDDRRGGIVTQASILTLTSYPTRTSPVKRGKWLLDEILAAPTPPPPPGVGVINEAGLGKDASLRQRFEQHRADPSCASCHARLDPLGFGLENYDAIGQWREKDGKFPLDSAGSLPDGRHFAGPGELRALLKADKGFVLGFAEKMLTYALGRGVEEYDAPVVERIVAEAASGENRFSRFVSAIAESDPFQKARGETK